MHPYQNLRCLVKINTDYGGDKIEWAKYWVNKGMDLIETMLQKSKGKYCFGDDITIADAFFIPHVQGGVARFGVDLTKYPVAEEVYKNLIEIEAFQKA